MEKQKEKQKMTENVRKHSTIRSIPKSLDKEFNEIGDGDWKKGMYETVEAWKIMHKNPEMKLMADVDILMSDLKLYYSDNHYAHFDNFPAVFRMFLKKGRPNFSIMMDKRLEKPISEFDNDKDSKVKK